MSKSSPQHAVELTQVLKGLALNRIPGWNFPGNFLEVSFDEVTPERTRLTVEPGPHCVDHAGHMSLGALGVLVDIGLGAAMRREVGLGARMATVAMSMQLNGQPLEGVIESVSTLDGFVHGGSARQGLMRSEILANGVPVGSANGTFIAMHDRGRTAPLPMRRREEVDVQPLAPADLTEEERVVYERARAALEGADGNSTFIERFWDLMPARTEAGALIEFTNGMHVGNRVGHTQGGLTFALAGAASLGVFGDEWRLVGISAWYVAPGTGPMLRAESTAVHQGRLTAVARTRILDAEGRVVLEAMTHHARAA